MCLWVISRGLWRIDDQSLRKSLPEVDFFIVLERYETEKKLNKYDHFIAHLYDYSPNVLQHVCSWTSVLKHD